MRFYARLSKRREREKEKKTKEKEEKKRKREREKEKEREERRKKLIVVFFLASLSLSSLFSFFLSLFALFSPEARRRAIPCLLCALQTSSHLVIA